MQLGKTTAIVTGGASGLGEATVRMIIAGGGRVGILDMNATRGEALADELGSNAIFVTTDVTDEAQVSAALDATTKAFGNINAALSFAGIAVAVKTLGKDGPHPLDLYRKVIDVNLIGIFNVSRLAAERIAKNEVDENGLTGVIINTASIAGYEGQKGQPAYGSSKAGVIGLTLPMARDLASYGIRVNTIAPGLIMTPMMEQLPEEAREALGKQPLLPRRLGRAEEIAHLARFLIENDYMNGETVRMDAGIRLP